jgi:hypothetical protein
MKLLSRSLLAALFALTVGQLSANDPAPSGNAAHAKARSEYPLQTCIVSGEHLDAGQIVEYVYQEPGKPDRLVRLCCRKCLARFKGDPAKYLKKLDEAAAKPGKKN